MYVRGDHSVTVYQLAVTVIPSALSLSTVVILFQYTLGPNAL